MTYCGTACLSLQNQQSLATVGRSKASMSWTVVVLHSHARALTYGPCLAVAHAASLRLAVCLVFTQVWQVHVPDTAVIFAWTDASSSRLFSRLIHFLVVSEDDQYFSAYFFNQNNIFLSQQIRRNNVSTCFFSEANGTYIYFHMHDLIQFLRATM